MINTTSWCFSFYKVGWHISRFIFRFRNFKPLVEFRVVVDGISKDIVNKGRVNSIDSRKVLTSQDFLKFKNRHKKGPHSKSGLGSLPPPLSPLWTSPDFCRGKFNEPLPKPT